MSRFCPFIPLAAFCLAVFLSCSNEGKVIPKKKMVSIYADMFMADQWLSQNYKAERKTDTTSVYEAVFEKYGYDSQDYRTSVEHYIQDPDRFARILRQTVLELEDRMVEQRAELRKRNAADGGKKELSFSFDFDTIWIFENGYPRTTVRDSLDYFRGKQEYFILDLKPLSEPAINWHEIYFSQDSIVTPDTAAIPDTAAVCDTAFSADTAIAAGTGSVR